VSSCSSLSITLYFLTIYFKNMILKGQLGLEKSENMEDALGNYALEVHFVVPKAGAEENLPPPRIPSK
jgi:hypothetical protein